QINNYSCVLAVLFCLASCEGARTRDQDRQRLQQLQTLSKRTTNSNNQLRITHEAVQIYKRYRGRAAAGANVERTLNNRVRDFESKVVLVDGVPRQGGAFWESIKNAGGQIPEEVWQNAQNLFKTSSKTLVEGIVAYLMNLLV
ncbi:hypothetical protein KR038_011607, partial [Drosophila bunnanda]